MKTRELPKNIFEQIKINRVRTAFIFLIFPILIIGLTFLGVILSITFGGENYANNILSDSIITTRELLIWILLATLIYSLISYFLGAKIILKSAGATPLEKRANPRLYNMVENTSIAAGLPKTPDIFIIDDESLNAFATGTTPENSKIAVTKGLLAKLDDRELEGVIGHEISHILNRDIRVMLIAVTLLGAIQMIGEILIRTGGGHRKSKGNILPIIGILFLTIGVFMGMIAKLAISREREYLADANGAYLTTNPRGLSSALRKISQDARVEILDKKPSMANLCIADPILEAHTPFWKKIWSTHPPIEERIRLLEKY